jgi:hypothetical protein
MLLDLEETVRKRVINKLFRLAQNQFQREHPTDDIPSFTEGVLCVSTARWLSNRYIPDIPTDVEAHVLDPHPTLILPPNRPQLYISDLYDDTESILNRHHVMDFFIAGPYDHPDLQGYDMTYSVVTRPARYVTNKRSDREKIVEGKSVEGARRIQPLLESIYTVLEVPGTAWPNQIAFG